MPAQFSILDGDSGKEWNFVLEKSGVIAIDNLYEGSNQYKFETFLVVRYEGTVSGKPKYSTRTRTHLQPVKSKQDGDGEIFTEISFGLFCDNEQTLNDVCYQYLTPSDRPKTYGDINPAFLKNIQEPYATFNLRQAYAVLDKTIADARLLALKPNKRATSGRSGISVEKLQGGKVRGYFITYSPDEISEGIYLTGYLSTEHKRTGAYGSFRFGAFYPLGNSSKLESFLNNTKTDFENTLSAYKNGTISNLARYLTL